MDTSPYYGNAEELIGHSMTDLGIPEEFRTARKVDRENRDEEISRMERSFELLGGESLELIQVYNLRGTSAKLATVLQWREQGLFRHEGVTTSSAGPHESMTDVMQKKPPEFIRVDYSLGNRNAAEAIPPLA